MRTFESAALLASAAVEDRDAPASDDSSQHQPEQPAQPGSREHVRPVARTAGALRCLAVDDDPGILELLAVWLARYDVELLTAPSGKEALALIESGEVHLLVTDLVMAGMDGIELLRRLQHLPRRPKVLGITGVAGGETLGMAFTAIGAEGFLMKPFSREEFIAALQAALGRELRPR
ncbi:MAG: response regulator [Planctomycetota bacterium]|nr:response regulator [Planctomycetota bacterium]